MESYDLGANLKDGENVVVLKFTINNNYTSTNSIEFNKAFENCKNLAVVLVFRNESRDILWIQWKSKRIEQFLTLNDLDDITTVDKNNLYEFIIKFLTRSLQAKHLGEQSC